MKPVGHLLVVHAFGRAAAGQPKPSIVEVPFNSGIRGGPIPAQIESHAVVLGAHDSCQYVLTKVLGECWLPYESSHPSAHWRVSTTDGEPGSVATFELKYTLLAH